jgi:nucleotide-binding universal stress UspA family protein
MSTDPQFRMVVALDATEYAEIVLQHALDQAARHDAPDLHFLTVVEDDAPFDDAKRRLARQVADELDDFRGDRRDWRGHLHVRRGKPADEIAQLAGEVAADLIVVGRFAHETAEDVLSKAPCPTLVVQLTDIGVEPVTCERCVAVRRESDGERWFCDQHSSDRWGLATVRFPIATGWDRGGLMW